MMKRNLGSALAGKTAASRKRDMRLKALTHDVMIVNQRVETEHGCHLFCSLPFDVNAQQSNTQF